MVRLPNLFMIFERLTCKYRFSQRNNISSSLGDWRVNTSKFPGGFAALADDLSTLNMRLGIWVEPEMVSEESELYAAHPDWTLHAPGRPSQLGRNQLVLDLTREEVRDYLFETLFSVIATADISYVKWDMNRPLTGPVSLRPGAKQSETSHRYVLGLYDLQRRLLESFPDLLLENCASGGGRFDAGMLYFSPQIWCSDNTDALCRMKIQYGSSIAYPASCLGALLSVVPNHITGNSSRSRTRAFVSFSGSGFGFTMDFSDASISEILQFKEQVFIYRQIAHVIRNGDMYHLWNPFKVSYAAWMYVSRDKQEAIVFAFSLNRYDNFNFFQSIPHKIL
jgi:alpha-galactosidase